MEIKTGKSIYFNGLDVIEANKKSDYNAETTRERSEFDKKEYVTVKDLLEWVRMHDSKIEDAKVHNHNGEVYLEQSYHTISIKELKEALNSFK